MAPILPKSVTENAEKLKQYFVTYPDFPKKGIMFWDVFALYANPEAFCLLNKILAGYAEIMKDSVDVVVGIEARGFLLGPVLATSLNCTFVPVRKKGKLPGVTKEMIYSSEYATSVVEIQENSIKPGQRVIIADDCIATGGTLNATGKLIEEMGGKVADCVVIYTIPELNHDLSYSVTSLCS